MGFQAVGSSLNRILLTIQNICINHLMKPSFGYGDTGDFNASNQTLMPAIWIEPMESNEFNSDGGVRVEELALNVYAIDRINKGDNNFQEIHSDMKYLLQTIIAEIRESSYTRNLFIGLSRQNLYFKPVSRWGDENCNGWMVKLIFRLPVVYTPCNSPIDPIETRWNGLFNVVDGGVGDVFASNPNVFINVIDAGVDSVFATGSNSIINVIDAGENNVF